MLSYHHHHILSYHHPPNYAIVISYLIASHHVIIMYWHIIVIIYSHDSKTKLLLFSYLIISHHTIAITIIFCHINILIIFLGHCTATGDQATVLSFSCLIIHITSCRYHILAWYQHMILWDLVHLWNLLFIWVNSHRSDGWSEVHKGLTACKSAPQVWNIKWV